MVLVSYVFLKGTIPYVETLSFLICQYEGAGHCPRSYHRASVFVFNDFLWKIVWQDSLS